MDNTRKIQANHTRKNILRCANEAILYSGFQAASIGDILRQAEISKGCFYHHFPTKQALGYAVLENTFELVQTEFLAPLFNSANPLQAIINYYQPKECNIDNESIKLGCPINNLAQEMSPIDEGFRQMIENFYMDWEQQLTTALQRCQNNGQMDQQVNANEIAALIIATTQGAIGIAKNSQQASSMTTYTRGLIHYLTSLQQ